MISMLTDYSYYYPTIWFVLMLSMMFVPEELDDVVQWIRLGSHFVLPLVWLWLVVADGLVLDKIIGAFLVGGIVQIPYPSKFEKLLCGLYTIIYCLIAIMY